MRAVTRPVQEGNWFDEVWYNVCGARRPKRSFRRPQLSERLPLSTGTETRDEAAEAVSLDFQGHLANRQIVSFGLRYDCGLGQVVDAPTSTELPTATPTGRPRASPLSLRKPVTTSRAFPFG